MIDTSKYEGHTPAPWHEIFMQGDEYNNGYDDLQTLGFNGAAQDLIADAPLLLEEVKRLTEFRDKVLAAFVEMSQNKRSLTYLLNESGYLNYYSRADYLKGLHPHGLGLFELKDEWMEKAQQYLESEEE